MKLKSFIFNRWISSFVVVSILIEVALSGTPLLRGDGRSSLEALPCSRDGSFFRKRLLRPGQNAADSRCCAPFETAAPPRVAHDSWVKLVAPKVPVIDLDSVKADNNNWLSGLVGKTVLVKGVAKNAMEGGVLTGKNRIVIVKGVDSWPKNVYGKSIEIEGILTSKNYPKRRSRTYQAPEGLWFFVTPK